MKQLSTLLLLFLPLLLQAQYHYEYELTKDFKPSAEAFEILPEDSHYHFKAVNSNNQLLSVQFNNIEAWENLQLPYDSLYQILDKVIQSIQDQIPTAGKGRNVNIRYINAEQQLIELETDHSINQTFLHSDKLHTVKTSMDTIIIIHSSVVNQRRLSIVYQFIINDIITYKDAGLLDFKPFLNAIDNRLKQYRLQHRHVEKAHHQVQGYYHTQSGTLDTRTYTLYNRTLNRIFLDVSLGIYSGYHYPISFAFESTFGIVLKETKDRNRLFIGINALQINPKLIDNTMHYGSVLAVEIGTVPNRGLYKNFINGGRASLALGVYEYNINTNSSHIFENKPAAYLGINLPVYEHIQLGLHFASDLKFQKENADLNKYMFGISMKMSMGSLLNSIIY